MNGRSIFLMWFSLVAAMVLLPVVMLGEATVRGGVTYFTQSVVTEISDTPAMQTCDPLEQALFIGAGVTCGLRDGERLAGADYFCQPGMSVFNVFGCRLSDADFQCQTLEMLLAQREYGCVVIELGRNESGCAQDTVLEAYRELLNTLSRTQPQAAVVLLDSGGMGDPLRCLADEFHGYYLTGGTEGEALYRAVRELEQ